VSGPLPAEVEWITLDGEQTVKVKCPGCREWRYLDDDQYHGRVSCECDCGRFHETIRFALFDPRNGGRVPFTSGESA